MNKWILLSFCVLVQILYNIQLSACDDILIAKDGVNISYQVTRSDFCQTGENKVQLVFGISLANCIIECGLRNHCLALSYHHGMPSCLLLRSKDTNDVIDEQCDYILKSDILVHTSPCVNGCSEGMACDLDTETCKTKECPLPSPVNGKVNGNRLSIGSKVRYKCEIGHIETTDTYTGICLVDGTWSHVANCTEIVWAEWSSWTPCDVTCDDGTQHRTRTCSFGDSCIGDTTEDSSCNDEPCPPENVWTEWSSWTPCDVTCDDGTQHRTRTCSTGEDCIGDTSETSSCNDGPCPEPTDCNDVFQSGQTTSGVYPIHLTTGEQMTVRCAMSPNTGGWTVIQRRISASDFYKTWEEYKTGFGDLDGNFWLGNDNIWALTQTGHWKLRVELTWHGESGYAEYSHFAIGNEGSNYVLSVGGYTGTIGDSLSGHNAKQYTTYDRDNDIYEPNNCALLYKGAWWHGKCHSSNLNGEYGNLEYARGLTWQTWQGYDQSMDTTQMKIQKVA